jgi:hypothetical protein
MLKPGGGQKEEVGCGEETVQPGGHGEDSLTMGSRDAGKSTLALQQRKALQNIATSLGVIPR